MIPPNLTDLTVRNDALLTDEIDAFRPDVTAQHARWIYTITADAAPLLVYELTDYVAGIVTDPRLKRAAYAALTIDSNARSRVVLLHDVATRVEAGEHRDKVLHLLASAAWLAGEDAVRAAAYEALGDRTTAMALFVRWAGNYEPTLWNVDGELDRVLLAI